MLASDGGDRVGGELEQRARERVAGLLTITIVSHLSCGRTVSPVTFTSEIL